MGTDPPLSGSPATLDPALALLGQAARELGLRAWVVGGYVRDHLLGRVPHELDVVVEGDALRLAERFAQLTGARRPVLFPRFGTAQVTWQGRLVEFATARAESYSPDSRKPKVRPATLEEDLLRRDFTVNAILMDFEGQIDDPGSIAELSKLARIEMGSQGAGNVVKPGLPKLGAVKQPLDENHFGILPDSRPSIQATLGAR